jgi:hypothetical protein
MNPTDSLFKMPIRLFDPIEMEQDEITEEITNNIERYIPDYVVGWKRISIEKIIDWQECFARGKTLDEVRRDGLDCTLVKTMGEVYICDWDFKSFEKAYNKHIRKMSRYMEKEIREDLEESNQLENEQTRESKSHGQSEDNQGQRV